jgi:hypothetical protein
MLAGAEADEDAEADTRRLDALAGCRAETAETAEAGVVAVIIDAK